jgi:putative spermidine/putrescine transport system substrate-binding protein
LSRQFRLYLSRQKKGRFAAAAASLAAVGFLLTACGGSSSHASTDAAGTGGCPKVDAATATSLAAFGGMNCLVDAAKAEGHLNVITLPADWANYGTIMKDFTAEYGIQITDENPDGSSQDEINAMEQLKGQSRAPDVLDMGTSFAISATKSKLLAPYMVSTWDEIPADAKDASGYWFDDYGGYVAIGCDTARVPQCPTSFAQLLEPQYKNMVGINGNPTEAGAAFAAVFAAAIANGGSFSDIEPGLQFFSKLHKAGNFVPVTAGPSTVQSGQTPIVIWWDYLQESEIASEVPTWKVNIPTDGIYASYYSQAISATAPHPAAARLWEEYLYSTTGQNLWLEGHARPIELSTLVANGTVDETAYKALPPAPSGGDLTFPTQAQLTQAQDAVTQGWSSAVG